MKAGDFDIWYQKQMLFRLGAERVRMGWRPTHGMEMYLLRDEPTTTAVTASPQASLRGRVTTVLIENGQRVYVLPGEPLTPDALPPQAICLPRHHVIAERPVRRPVVVCRKTSVQWLLHDYALAVPVPGG